MILIDKLEKPYEQYSTRSKLWFQCDYCGKEFQRDKKSRERLRQKIAKDGCGSKECTQKKREEVFFSVYGDNNLFQSNKFKEELKRHNLEVYGSEEYFSSKDFQLKREKSLLQKYGVCSPLQNEEVKEKQRQTCRELYNVENYAQHQDFLEKSKQTNLEVYGTEFAIQNEQVKEKKNHTCLEKYGVEHYTQTDEYLENRKKKCLEEFGVEFQSQLPENREKARTTTKERYGVNSYSQTQEFKERYVKTCLEKYGVPSGFLINRNQYGKTQNEIKDWLKELGFQFDSNYSILNGKEIDLFNQDRKLAIEYCGLFWHNELSPSPRGRSYHYGKWKTCRDNGIKLITIFEDEWKYKRRQCENIISSSLGIFDYRTQARKCKVEEISKQEFAEFCESNHLLGANNLGIIFYALKQDGETISAMSLGRHHRAQKFILTLDRFCCKNFVQVVGGASKLFSRCTQAAKQQGFSSIVSWSDNRWSSGDAYVKLGFSLSQELPPDYSYVNLKNCQERISKQSQQKKTTKCPPDLTEKEWAAHRGLARIWDCGKKKWEVKL